MARQVNDARTNLLTEGRPVFIIASHYGTTSLLSFYIPEARHGVPDNPMVYCIKKEPPQNQFYFWPGYQGRKGENAIFVAPMDRTQAELPAGIERAVQVGDAAWDPAGSLQKPCLSLGPIVRLPRIAVAGPGPCAGRIPDRAV